MAPFQGRTVLVTGATGFIGRALVQRLSAARARVVGVTRREVGQTAHGVEWVLTDLGKPGSTAPLLAQFTPSVVFNLVGYGVDSAERSLEPAERLNAQLPRELAAGLERTPSGQEWSGCRLIQAGSAFEYGNREGLVSEEAECIPRSHYASTKLAGTQAVAQAAQRGLRCLVARIPTVYGPGEHPHRLLPSLLRLERGTPPLRLTAGEQQRDFIHVAEVVEGLCRLAVCDPLEAPIVNLGTGRLTSVRHFTELVLKAAGLPQSRVVFGARPHREDEVFQGPLSVRRLRLLTSWTPQIQPEEGIRQTLAMLRMEHPEISRG